MLTHDSSARSLARGGSPNRHAKRHARASSPSRSPRGLAQTASGTRSSPAGWCERLTSSRWALPAILVVQGALSLHLIRADAAFRDEALYLLAGHMEWAHFLSDAPVPRFQAYFSGSPVLYPMIGAVADAAGGLAAARALSLFFMLGATTLLHGVTRRIFSRRAAVFAAAIFSGAGATQYLGAFATYDAMALACLALAVWFGARSFCGGSAALAVLSVAAGVALSLADATKYATILFDPAVVLAVFFYGWHRSALRRAIAAAVIQTSATCLILVAAVAAPGSGYRVGLDLMTVDRAASTVAPAGNVLVSLGWVGSVGALAVIGAMTAALARRGFAYGALGVTLALAVWLAPAEQARIFAISTVLKHVGFGEWFGAAVAGMALASLGAAVPTAKADGALRAAWAAVAASTALGFLLATNQFVSWPGTNALNKFQPLVRADKHLGPAVGSGNVIRYYLSHAGLRSGDYFTDTRARSNGRERCHRDPSAGVIKRGLLAYEVAVEHGYLEAITRSKVRACGVAERIIRADIERSGGYRLPDDISSQAGGWRDVHQIWTRRSRS